MQTDLNHRGHLGGFAAAAFALVAVLLAVWASPMAAAVEVTSLYSVEVPLDPDDPDAQSSAYRRALAEVLVRITGTGAAAESEELALLFPNPARFVRQYRPGPDNTLIVSLDGPAIERILRQSGATVWGSERPLTIVWLAVDWGLGDREIVAADDPDSRPGDGRSIDRNQVLRERVEAVATRRGIPIVFPLLDAEDLQAIGFSDIWGGFDDPLREASARYEAQSVLLGRIRPDDLQPPRWTWYYGDQRFGWPGQPEEAIDQLADALAARDAIRGDQEVESIELTISGIDSVRVYGQVQQYIENLRAVENVLVKSAAADRIIYSVNMPGGAERLESILALSSLLERDDNDFYLDNGPFGMNDFRDNRVRSLNYRYRAASPQLPQSPSLPETDADPLPGIDPEF